MEFDLVRIALPSVCCTGFVMIVLPPNKPDAPNPAMTLQNHSGRERRGVGDLERSATVGA